MKKYTIIKLDGEKLIINASKYRIFNKVHYFATTDICDNVVYNVSSVTYSEIPPTTENLLAEAKREVENYKQMVERTNARLKTITDEYEKLRREVNKREDALRYFLRDFESLLNKTFMRKREFCKIIDKIKDGNISTHACLGLIGEGGINLTPWDTEPKLGQPLENNYRAI